MKNFHFLKFFLVIIAIYHVHGAVTHDSDRSTGSDDQNSSSESIELYDHYCDPLAANVTDNRKREGPDSFNQVFPIKGFLKYFETNDYNVARATPSPIESTDNTSLKFCHVPFLSRDCGPLRYHQKLSNVYDPKRKEGFKGIRLNVDFVAMNLENGKAIRYDMEIEGINEDDYIFQWVKGTSITAYEIDHTGEKKLVTIPENVLDSLKSEFALNRVGLTESPDQPNLPYDDRSEVEDDQQIDDDDQSPIEDAEKMKNISDAAHVEDTQDGKKSADQTHAEEDKKLKSKLDETHAQRPEEIQRNSSETDSDEDEEIQNEPIETSTSSAKKLKQKYEENFENRDLLYIIYISCDGKSIWAAYNKSIVDVDEEGVYTKTMDDYLLQLRKSVGIAPRVHSPVKPVSTYMPTRFDETMPKFQTIQVS